MAVFKEVQYPKISLVTSEYKLLTKMMIMIIINKAAACWCLSQGQSSVSQAMHRCLVRAIYTWSWRYCHGTEESYPRKWCWSAEKQATSTPVNELPPNRRMCLRSPARPPARRPAAAGTGAPLSRVWATGSAAWPGCCQNQPTQQWLRHLCTRFQRAGVAHGTRRVWEGLCCHLEPRLLNPSWEEQL